MSGERARDESVPASASDRTPPVGDVAGADWLREADTDAAITGERVVEVLSGNWDALLAYQHCAQQVVGGGYGVVHLGIAAAEVRAAVALLRLPRTRWPDILDGAQHIGQLVAAALNRRAAHR